MLELLNFISRLSHGAASNHAEVGTQTPWIARNQMVGDFSIF